jgi:hypothetical protein
VLYGVNTTGNGVLVWDRWSCENHNAVVLARSGAGKSYFVKLDVLRNLYLGVQVAVIDPDDEYADLARHVGGRLIQLGQPGVRINPLDLPVGDHRADAPAPGPPPSPSSTWSRPGGLAARSGPCRRIAGRGQNLRKRGSRHACAVVDVRVARGRRTDGRTVAERLGLTSP